MKLRSRRHLPPARLKAARVRNGVGAWAPVALSALSMLVGVMATPANAAETAGAAADTTFATTFLRTRPNETVDVARFSRANQVAPGVYNLDIWVNGRRLDRIDVQFIGGEAERSARPCLSRKLLENLGVDFSKVQADVDGAPPAAAPGAGETDACLDLAREVPGATVDFDFGEQTLTLSVPQKYVRRSARGYVSPDRWDYGVNAGFLNYNASSYRTNVAGQSSTSGYLGLNAGVNFNG